MFVSVDAWHDTTFDRLAKAMLAELPASLHTVVDEADVQLTAAWRRAGFTIRRREWEYVVPTDPQVTGLDEVLPPAGVTIVPAGQPRQGLLRWWTARSVTKLRRSSKYAVAAMPDRNLGLIQVVTVNRTHRAGRGPGRKQRRGIAWALPTRFAPREAQ